MFAIFQGTGLVPSSSSTANLSFPTLHYNSNIHSAQPLPVSTQHSTRGENTGNSTLLKTTLEIFACSNFAYFLSPFPSPCLPSTLLLSSLRIIHPGPIHSPILLSSPLLSSLPFSSSLSHSILLNVKNHKYKILCNDAPI